MHFKKVFEKFSLTLLLIFCIIIGVNCMNGYDIEQDRNITNNVQSRQNGRSKRIKRFLSFRPGMRFLIRVNGREDALYDLNTWAHAFGFRANYDIIQPFHSFPFHFINRRSVHDEVENFMGLYHGLDGKACLLKSFCDATGWSSNANKNTKVGMLYKLFETVFSKRTKYTDEQLDCKSLEQKCPFSLLELLPYTDL